MEQRGPKPTCSLYRNVNKMTKAIGKLSNVSKEHKTECINYRVSSRKSTSKSRVMPFCLCVHQCTITKKPNFFCSSLCSHNVLCRQEFSYGNGSVHLSRSTISGDCLASCSCCFLTKEDLRVT